MKKFIIIVASLVCLVLLCYHLYFYQGIYINLSSKDPTTTFVKTENEEIWLNKGNGFEPFEIRGVDMGSGYPGEWSTDYAIKKEDYLRWFQQIQDMGANTIRIYSINDDNFYNAFYEYNINNPTPLYLLHGVWLNDYLYHSRRDAFDEDLCDEFINNGKMMVDVIHGKRKISLGRDATAGSGTYNKDISPWVLGYILGVEWEDTLVAYTNEKYKNNNDYNSYNGKYLYTSEDASPFESMLAEVGDNIIEYESERYHTQRIVAFSNWPTTDPFQYPDYITNFFLKCATVDMEHILCKDTFLSGRFASYHIYPYYPDYLAYVTDFSELSFDVDIESCTEENGVLNTYKLYLKAIADHHSIPVVISEFGIPTSRGLTQKDINTGRNQGNVSETDQGEMLVQCYNDIRDAGCAGCCIFSWQDEWFKRTWNTVYAIDLMRTPYWLDRQVNEECFGLLAFDPGAKQSVCYIDGNVSEWTKEDIVTTAGDLTLSMKYDEASVYFMVEKPGFDLESDTIYIPIDTTPKSGSLYCQNNNLLFDHAADFLITIQGKNNSSIQVQEYYDVLRANHAELVYGFNTYAQGNIPDVDSPQFVDIRVILQNSRLIEENSSLEPELFTTGKLTYGNGNPKSKYYNSLADFIAKGDHIEIRIPWQLLNFSDPSTMQIHDDYYNGNYGIESIHTDEIYLGIADAASSQRISMAQKEMKGWNNDVTYHERLKPAYYVMQDLWSDKP